MRRYALRLLERNAQTLCMHYLPVSALHILHIVDGPLTWSKIASAEMQLYIR
jgi:hypothetical protein